MRLGRTYLVALVSFAVAFSSCSSFLSPAYDITGIRVEQKKNGFLVDLLARHKLGDVGAIITRDNWLIVTIVGATVDFDNLRSMEPNDLFSMCQVVGSKTSVQLTLKLKQDFRSCEVVRGPTDSDVSIALFSR